MLLSDPRARRVVERAAEISGWFEPHALPDGRARGFGFARYKNIASFAAVVAEVEVGEEVRLKRVWCAADAGLVITPDGARNQIEGGIIMGASFVMKEQVPFANGKVAATTWEDYPILRFSEVPESKSACSTCRTSRRSGWAKLRSVRPARRSVTRSRACSANASATCR